MTKTLLTSTKRISSFQEENWCLLLAPPPSSNSGCDLADLRYNALSFVFLQVRELSWLQWHPFSVSSSPMDGSYHLSILIKVLGEWTGKLSNLITGAQKEPQNSSDSKTNKITASIEGPYGHEVPYHLMQVSFWKSLYPISYSIYCLQID